MIFGIGCDIEAIERFEGKDRADGFIQKVFTEGELDYCFSCSNPAQHLAARFAAKEAVVKALNSGGIDSVGLDEIEVIRDEKGIPSIKTKPFNGRNLKYYISLSHCDKYALAYATVVCEEKDVG